MLNTATRAYLSACVCMLWVLRPRLCLAADFTRRLHGRGRSPPPTPCGPQASRGSDTGLQNKSDAFNRRVTMSMRVTTSSMLQHMCDC